jgi:hypothetical protein
MTVIGLDQSKVFELKKDSYLRPIVGLALANIICLFYALIISDTEFSLKQFLLIIAPVNILILLGLMSVKQPIEIKFSEDGKSLYIRYFNFIVGEGAKKVILENLNFTYESEKLDRMTRGYVLRIKENGKTFIKIKENEEYWNKDLLNDLYNELDKMQVNA